MISQSFNLVKRSTVQRNVLSGRLGYYSTLKSVLGLFTKEDYEHTEQALERVGLLDKLHSRAPTSCPAASSNAFPSRAPWCSAPGSFWPTSRSPRSTRSRRAPSCRTLRASTARRTSPWW